MIETEENGFYCQRTTTFLLALIFVLALLFVALEWNSSSDGWQFFATQEEDLEAELELEPLHREKDEVPMMIPQEPAPQEVKSEELNVVEEDIELPPDQSAPVATEPVQSAPETQDESPQAVDMYDKPLDFRVVEDLPQFPGGAVEFMKWLTKNLKYPASAQRRKIQGKVVAQFVVNRDGSITDLELVQHLDPQCDREALRVLRMMPKWKAGVMDAKPCRTLVCIPIVFKL